MGPLNSWKGQIWLLVLRRRLQSITGFLLHHFYVKGVDKKPLHLKFCFAHISAAKHHIFKIRVPTPHDIPLISKDKIKSEIRNHLGESSK